MMICDLSKVMAAFVTAICCFSVIGGENGGCEPAPGTLTYVARVKTRIASATVYSESLRKDMEVHYESLLDGDERLADYLSFYSNLVVSTKMALLKDAFRMRHARGMYRKDQELAGKLLTEVDREGLKRTPEESLYYGMLLTYGEPENPMLYEKAIGDYENKGCSPLELACLCNNYALLLEKKDKKKEACNWYLKAIQQPISGNRIGLFASNFEELVAKDKELSDSAFRSVDAHVAQIRSADDKVQFLSSLIGAGFYYKHPRLQRKYMGIVLNELDNVKDEWILADALFSLADRERKAANAIDAADLYERSLRHTSTNSIGWVRLNVLFGAVRNQFALRRSDAVHQQTRELIDEVLRADVHKKRKATMLALLAECCAKERDWLFFEEACGKSREYDGGVALTPLLADEALDALAARTDGAQTFSRIIEQTSDLGIKRVDDEVRALVEYAFRAMGKREKADAWHKELSSSLWADLLKVESLLCEGNPDSIDTAMKVLQELQPQAFSDGDCEYSEEDAQYMILSDLLAAYVEKSDLGGISKTLVRIEALRSKVTEDGQRKAFHDANRGSAYILLGDVQKGVAMLSEALCSIKDPPGNMASYYLSLGKGYYLLGDVDRALESVSKAREISRNAGNRFFYVRSSVSLVMFAVAQKNSEVPCEEILREIIPLAEKESYADDLANAYVARMQLIVNDATILREEKLKRLSEIQQKALSSARAPVIISMIFAQSATLKHEHDFPAESVLSDVEQYFKCVQLYIGFLKRTSVAYKVSETMRDLLFETLTELGDTEKIDYWNKIFEKRKTRDTEIAAAASSGGAAFLTLMEQVSRYESARQIVADEEAKPNKRRNKQLLAKAHQIKAELEQNFDVAKKRMSPQEREKLNALLADSFVIHPDSLGQLSSVLPGDTACLQFLQVGDAIVVYIASHDKPAFITRIDLTAKGLDSRKFAAKLVRLRKSLQSRGLDKGKLDGMLGEIYGIVFADLEESLSRLSVRRLIVNSSGLLRYVPFAALRDEKGYLIERFQITNITGNDLVRIAKPVEKRSLASVRAVVFADPTGDLPSGRKEGEQVAKSFRGSRLLVGEKASLEEFESLSGNVNFIHLATHAVLDPDEPSNSYVRFAGGKQWRYSDMRGFNIRNVDSFVLSACSTADVVDKSDGSEIESMAYQLLRASPSGSVLASFWKVDDEATAALMQVFYKHVVDSMRKDNTLDRGGAIREAQLAVMNDPKTASPYYWAAFSLFGDFR